jgi:hypothetical protein
VAEVCRRNERGAVVSAGDIAGAGTAVEREFQSFEIVRHGGDGDDVVAVDLQCVRVGAALDQRAGGVVPLEIDRDVKRGAASRVLDVRPLALGDQLLDLGDVALGRGFVQSGVDADVIGGRGGLGMGRRREKQSQKLTGPDRAMNLSTRHGRSSRPSTPLRIGY